MCFNNSQGYMTIVTVHLLSIFHFLSTPVSSLRLAFYIHSSFTLLEAAHLIQSSCSTMMIPSRFLPLYIINTRDIVDCNLTYSWESTFYSSLSQTLPVRTLTVPELSIRWTQLLTVETSTVSWSPNNNSLQNIVVTLHRLQVVHIDHHGF